MNQLHRIWNFKFSGLPYAICLMIVLVVKRVYFILFSNLVSLNLGEVGKGNKIYPGVVFRNPEAIKIGSNNSIARGARFEAELDEGYVLFGDNIVVGLDAILDFSGGLNIGDRVTISEGVVIQTHDHGIEPRSIPTPRGLIIEKGVWLATKSIILASVDVIGENAIVAAGAVVTVNVPANSIVAGVPARVVRKL